MVAVIPSEASAGFAHHCQEEIIEFLGIHRVLVELQSGQESHSNRETTTLTIYRHHTKPLADDAGGGGDGGVVVTVVG